MKNIIKLFVTFTIIVGSSIAFASEKNIKLILAAAEGGGTATMSTPLVSALEKRGYNVDLTIAGTCANARRLYESESGSTVVVWANSQLSEKFCDIGLPNEKNFLNIFFTLDNYFCAKDDPSKALQGNTAVAIDSALPSWVRETLTNYNPGLSLIPYENSAAIDRALVSNEVSAVFSDSGEFFQKNGRVTCKYVANSMPPKNYKSLGSEIGVENFDFRFVMYSFVKNMDENTKKDLRADLQNIFKTDDGVIEFMRNRQFSIDVQLDDSSTQLNSVINSVR